MKNIHELQKPTFHGTLSEIAQEYEKARNYVQFLKDVNVDMGSWSDEQKLAFNLHSLIGVESWNYERSGKNHNWEGFDHSRLLKKAVRLMDEFPNLEIDELLNIVKILKH